MPGRTIADSGGRRQYRVVVLAQESSSVKLFAHQLEALNCAVERAETLAEAQSVIAREAPHFAFIECLESPERTREIAGQFRDSESARASCPRLVGMDCKHCAPHDPRACGLDDHLQLPTDMEDLMAVLDMRSAEAGDPAVGAAGHAAAYHEEPVSEAVSQLPEGVQTAMLTAFVEYTAIRFAGIEAGLEGHDLGQVVRDLHAVKSGCLQMGFTAMAECCEEMRRAIDAKDVGTAQLSYRKLTAAFNGISGGLPRN